MEFGPTSSMAYAPENKTAAQKHRCGVNITTRTITILAKTIAHHGPNSVTKVNNTAKTPNRVMSSSIVPPSLAPQIMI
jgi:hypothetical protein